MCSEEAPIWRTAAAAAFSSVSCALALGRQKAAGSVTGVKGTEHCSLG